MKCSLKGKFITAYPKSYDFDATDKAPARHIEVYRMTIRDDDAFSEKDQFFTASVKMDIARAIGMDKPQFEKDHLGKDITLIGVLTPSFGNLSFSVEAVQN